MMDLHEKKDGIEDRVREHVRNHGVPIVVLLALTLVLTFPAFTYTGVYPSGIDTPAHLFKVELMKNMLQEHGKIFHWTDKWYGGYPFLTIYAPLSFYVVGVTDMVVQDITLSFNMFRAFLLFITGFIMFLIMERELDDRWIALGTGGLLMTAYPIYNNLFTIGRIAFASGIVLYLLSLYFLLDEELYTSEITRKHILFGVVLGLLLVTHPMSAYLLVYTGVLFLLIYQDRVAGIGLRPVLATTVIAFLLAMPYIETFLLHSFITEPFWIHRPLNFAQLPEFFMRRFGDTLPQYIGAAHLGLLVVGVVGSFYNSSKLRRFALLNFALFFVFFWGADLGILQFIPMGAQFDLSRFQSMFILYGVILAGYGIMEIRDTVDLSIDARYVTLILLGIIFLIVFADISPMISESSTWSPQFEENLSNIEMDESYRSMTVGMRHWDDYLVPIEMGQPSVTGWFQQADPHYYFTQTLQNTGGVWYPIDREFPQMKSPHLRKNLMQLSNTRYIIFGKEWAPEHATEYLLGNYVPLHRKNRQLLQETRNDTEFSMLYNSTALEIYTLDREMSFCTAVTPVWIKERYFEQARQLLASDDAFPRVPVSVDSRPSTLPSDTGAAVNCERPHPTQITVTTSAPTWVLVKESHYPYWKHSNGKAVYEAFGFMVTHVNGTAEITYNTETGGLRS